MALWMDTTLVLVVLLNFWLLGSSRLAACIRCVALQGILLGMFTVMAHEEGSLLRSGLLAIASSGVKGIAFPLLLLRALREADVRHEIEPYVGHNLSILVGLAALVLSLWLSARLPLPRVTPSSLIVPVALFTSFVGLFVI